MTLVVAGIATISAPHCGSSVISHIGYASIFGFFSGGYVGLTVIIIADLVGVDNVSSALGIILLFQGIAVFIGTPLTGECFLRFFFCVQIIVNTFVTFRIYARQIIQTSPAISLALFHFWWFHISKWYHFIRYSSIATKSTKSFRSN